MKRKIQTSNNNVRTLSTFRNYILLGVCAILAISSIFLTIETATIGLEMSKIEKNEAALLSQKRNLEETLIRSLSLAQLEEKGVELGFVKAANLVYVTGVAPVAKLP